MNFGVSNSSKRIRLAQAGDPAGHSSELTSLSMYYDPPLETLSLDEFERFPIERLRVMSVVEHALSRGVLGQELEKKLEATLNKYSSFMRCTTAEDIRRDKISHWVLRLAFSKSEDLRRRFLTFESFLFKYRFQKQTKTQIYNFMQKNEDLKGYKPIDSSERDLYKHQLQSVFLANTKNLFFNNKTADPVKVFQSTKWYKVAWTDVVDLVSKRKVFAHKGEAYVPHSDLVTILHSKFRSNLSLKLATGFKALPMVNEDERVRMILKTLQNAYLGPDYSNGQCFDKKSFSKEIIDSVAPRSFPLCMRALHSKLKNAHHLQYHGRVQFRLFLKGCGLTLQDSLAYFQQEFCKKNGLNPGEFVKKYAYNIRHAYGQEGKRKDYTPANCVKIILGTQPAAGQAHGCPFKTMEAAQLKHILLRQKGTKLSQGDVDYIIEPMLRKDFQVSCRRHFEKSHPKASLDNVGNHPNAWYEESNKYFNGLESQKQPSSSAAPMETSTASS